MYIGSHTHPWPWGAQTPNLSPWNLALQADWNNRCDNVMVPEILPQLQYKYKYCRPLLWPVHCRVDCFSLFSCVTVGQECRLQVLAGAQVWRFPDAEDIIRPTDSAHSLTVPNTMTLVCICGHLSWCLQFWLRFRFKGWGFWGWI